MTNEENRAARDTDAAFGPAWAAIQANHPALPDLPFGILQADMPGVLALTKVPRGWAGREKLAIEFAPGHLQHDPSEVFGTLLHEAAHVLEYARWGRMGDHRNRFAGFARELGLTTRPENLYDFDLASAWANTQRRWPAATENEIFIRVERQMQRHAKYGVKYRAEINDELRQAYAGTIADLGAALRPVAGALSAAAITREA